MSKLFIILFVLFSVSVSGQSLIDSFPYFEKFEMGDGGWRSTDTSGTIFQLGTPSDTILNSAYSGTNAWATGLGAWYGINQFASVESPIFDFSNLTGPPWIRVKLNYLTESCCDFLLVEYSLDEVNFQLLGTASEGQNWYNEPGQNFWSGNSNGWSIASIQDSILTGEPSVRLRFTFFSDFSQQNEGFLIDDVEITSGFEDMEMTSILNPETACSFSTQEPIEIEMKNLGQTAVSGVQAFYTINNGPVMFGSTLSFDAGQVKSFIFSNLADLSANGDYNLKVWVTSPGDTTRVNDTLKALIKNLPEINTFPYLEDFEAGMGDWSSDGENSTWAFGEPQKRIIVGDASTGLNSWTTGGLNFGNYLDLEKSMVYSPCFDMTSITDPIFEFDVWWNTEEIYDGANLQISRDNEQNWKIVGEVGTGLNWYNESDVSALSDSSVNDSCGWSGRNKTQNGSGEWLTAQNLVPSMLSDTSIRFRIFFASDVSARDDGFAFDNLFIYERVPEDVSLEELFIEEGGFSCLGDSNNVGLAIRNNGSSFLMNFPILYVFGSNSGSINYSDTLFAGQIDTIYFPVLVPDSSGIIDLLAYNGLLADPYQFNDTARFSLETFIITADDPIIGIETVCDSSSALLTVPADSTEIITWYSDSLRMNSIGSGTPWLTGIIKSDTGFYFDITSAAEDTIGPENHAFGDGSFSSVTGSFFLEVEHPVMIDQCWIDAQGTGNFEVVVKDLFGNILESKSIQHGSGWQKVFLGIRLGPGNYVLEVDPISGGDLFRNTSGAKYSDYLIPDIMRITGNRIDPSFYYYLYNWEISVLESCPGVGSYEVKIGNIVPDAAFSFLQDKNRVEFFNLSNSGTNYRWEFGDGTISFESNPFHFYDSGAYEVLLKVENQCGADSVMDSVHVFLINSLSEKFQSGLETKIFPNPGQDFFKLEISGLEFAEGSIMVFNLQGQLLLKERILGLRQQIQTKELSPGTYFIKIQLGSEMQVRRWVKN